MHLLVLLHGQNFEHASRAALFITEPTIPAFVISLPRYSEPFVT